MNKNLLLATIIVLVLICLGLGYFVNKERNEKISLSMDLAKVQSEMAKAGPRPSGGPRPKLLLKGDKFADNPISQKAYLIFPVTGQLSKDAQTALTGWTVKTTANTDGSTQVDLIPKEAEDVKQSFTVKTGYKLYFIEMTLSDDATGVDENRGDDMGVLVDPQGMVQ